MFAFGVPQPVEPGLHVDPVVEVVRQCGYFRLADAQQVASDGVRVDGIRDRLRVSHLARRDRRATGCLGFRCDLGPRIAPATAQPGVPERLDIAFEREFVDEPPERERVSVAGVLRRMERLGGRVEQQRLGERGRQWTGVTEACVVLVGWDAFIQPWFDVHSPTPSMSIRILGPGVTQPLGDGCARFGRGGRVGFEDRGAWEGVTHFGSLGW